MAIEVKYIDNSGNEKTSFIETRDDTNLLLGMPKSPFTILRSHFEDANGDTQYEFWIKCSKYYRAYNYSPYEWFWASYYPYVGLYSIEGVFYEGVGDGSYPTRSNDRPRKIVFDSGRTAVHDDLACIAESIDGNSTNSCWTYVGGTSDGIFGGHTDGNCKIYGYLIQYFGPSNGWGWWYTGASMVYAGFMYASDNYQTEGQVKQFILNMTKVDNRADYSEAFRLVFSGPVAEIRDWEIVSNTPPTPNTYYVAVLTKKKRDLLEVKTTQTFGAKCGDVLGGDWASRLSEEQYNTRVVDDMVLMV